LQVTDKQWVIAIDGGHQNHYGDGMAYAEVFIYLQLLDFLTTLVGFKMGAAEASPFVRWLMHLGPIAGVALSKGIALAVAGACVWTNKLYLIRWISYWYAGLVIWNICIILAVKPH
jgi:uncharacterized protein DUF5658